MFRHFVRARLHRRLFFWFTLGMIITGVAGAEASRVLGGRSWRDGAHGAQQLVVDQFTALWKDPAQRDRFAGDLSRELGLGVELLDSQGQVLVQSGPPATKVLVDQAIVRDGVTVGRIRLSVGGLVSHWRTAVPFGVAALALWGFLGFLSRRLAWPYYQLAYVAREIGAGNARARAPMRRQFGEARMLARAINDMADRIERQLREQRELLAAVSHELRTPLARMRLLVELMRTGASSAKHLDDMDQETVEMDRLVGELLASARVEFGATTFRVLDPRDLATRALERAGLPASLLELPDSPTPRLEGDATLLLRALANLIENAQNHGQGLTRLRVRSTDEEVVFEVEDQGPGIARGEEDRIFQPFAKGDASGSGEHASLGLGLSLVRRIALVHAGSVRATNRPGGGAMLALRLPIGEPLDLERVLSG